MIDSLLILQSPHRRRLISSYVDRSLNSVFRTCGSLRFTLAFYRALRIGLRLHYDVKIAGTCDERGGKKDLGS